jgi:hypothetical protein
MVLSEFLDLNHTSKKMILVSLMIPKFAPEPSIEHRRTSESGHYSIIIGCAGPAAQIDRPCACPTIAERISPMP